MKFHENIFNSLMFKSGQDLVTKTSIYKVQRGITKKIYKQELKRVRSVEIGHEMSKTWVRIDFGRNVQGPKCPLLWCGFRRIRKARQLGQ